MPPRDVPARSVSNASLLNVFIIKASEDGICPPVSEVLPETFSFEEV
jgi:hypothetical protein